MSTGPVYHFADPRLVRISQVRPLCSSRASNALWARSMTRNPANVTCKRCLAKMPKPAAA